MGSIILSVILAALPRPGAALPDDCTAVPVMPQAAEGEERYSWKNEYRTPVFGGLISEDRPPAPCEGPPDEADVLRALRCDVGTDDDFQIVSERLVDRVDPPRFFPQVGMAQLHHCHWECTVYSGGSVAAGGPLPSKAPKVLVRVVYIDKDCLHLCPGPETTGR